MPQRSRYTIEIVNSSGQLVADVSGIATGRRYTVRRNRAETINLSFDLGEATRLARALGLSFTQLFAPGVNEVRVMRGARPMVGGQIVYVEPQLTADSRTMEVRATGFLDLFKDRYMLPTFPGTNERGETVYNATDMGAVAWDIISKTQALTNGSFGVTQGTIQASRLMGETYQPFATNIKDILIGLTERINGIDFAFTPEKVFNVYYPGLGTDKTELLFSYPGNIQEISAPIDATEIVNLSINRGSGNGLDQQIIRSRLDLATQPTYSRRERIDDYPSINVAATLDEKGEETLRRFATPTRIPQVTLDGAADPPLGSYWMGDRVRFAVNDPAFAELDGQSWRINEIDVTVSDLDHERVTLKVGYS